MKYNVGDHAVIRIGEDWYPAVYGKASHVPLYGWVRQDQLPDDLDIEFNVEEVIKTNKYFFADEILKLPESAYNSLRVRRAKAMGIRLGIMWARENV
jgi:hypothetical protein